jgi:sporulation protein YlmC with PRC-barrel domain
MIDAKDKSIVFVMKNAGREFYLSTKNAVKIDYNLIDRVIRAICVNTDRST